MTPEPQNQDQASDNAAFIAEMEKRFGELDPNDDRKMEMLGAARAGWQAAIDRLSVQLADAQNEITALKGLKFSDRNYHAIKSRLDKAERDRDVLKARLERGIAAEVCYELLDRTMGEWSITATIEDLRKLDLGPARCKRCLLIEAE